MEKNLRNFYAESIFNDNNLLKEAWLIWSEIDSLVDGYFDDPVNLGPKLLPMSLCEYAIYHKNFSELFLRLPAEVESFDSMSELVLWYLTLFSFNGESNLTLATDYATQSLLYKVNNSSGRRIVSGKRQFKDMIKTKRNVAPRCGAFALAREVLGGDFLGSNGAIKQIIILTREIESALREAFGKNSKHATGEPLALGNKNIWLKEPDYLKGLMTHQSTRQSLPQLLSLSWRMSVLKNFGGSTDAVHKFMKSRAARINGTP